MNHKENTVLMIVRLYVAFIMMREQEAQRFILQLQLLKLFCPTSKDRNSSDLTIFNISILNKPQHFPLSLFCLQKSDSFDLVLLHIVLVIGAVGPATLFEKKCITTR